MQSISNVIQFADHLRPSVHYREALDEFADKLEAASDEFYGIALSLAINGKWKKWDDSMPVGAQFYFSEDMFYGTGDEFVTEAINLRVAMSDLAEKIRKKVNAHPKK